MARLLRLDLAVAWYHVTVRGNEQKPIYRDDRDRAHFLEFLRPLERTISVASARTITFGPNK